MGQFRRLGMVAFMVGIVMFMLLGNEVGICRAAEGDQVICNMSQEGLMACKPSVSGAKPAPPSVQCCSALSHADLRCLCSYKNSNLLPALGIDPNLALQLPKKCNLPQPIKC